LFSPVNQSGTTPFPSTISVFSNESLAPVRARQIDISASVLIKSEAPDEFSFQVYGALARQGKALATDRASI
jgi:hypothetical protein